MKKSTLLGVATVLLACLASSSYADWNLASQFDANNNPVGAWSYGYASALGSFTPFTWHGLTGGSPARPIWSRDANYQDPRTLAAKTNLWKNTMAITFLGVQPGEVSLHPDTVVGAMTDGNMCVVRWTSPISGDITLVGSFGQGDTGVVDCFIAKSFQSSTSMLLTSYNAATTQTFDLVTRVGIGDTIDFAVGPGEGLGWAANTPLVVTIVPEPAMLSLLALGGMAMLRRRK